MRIPDNSQRTLIVGRTGSGKTRGACWNLGMRDLVNRPWIVLNHKGEELIDSIEGAQHVDLDFVPKKPGLYVYHPVPQNDDEAVDNLLWKIHAAERTGVYVDEGYMIDRRSKPMNAILTQGRSKQIPLIILSQRPVGLTRFAISEADFYQLYHLIDKADRERLKGFVPTDLEHWMAQDANSNAKLPQYHSLWYDVSRNELVLLRPVPSDDIIRANIESQLVVKDKKKFFI